MTNITTILNTSVKDFSLYTIFNRAIPSAVDGLKPVQRKILYACYNMPVKLTKTFSFAGAAILQSNYHHGSSSIEDAINNLTATHNNVVPMLFGEGSFGSRLVPVAAASRYTSVKFNKTEIDKWFKDEDIAPVNPDPEYPEPLHYLPIIPWVLVNGINGIATGFAVEIQPHNPHVLAKLCKDYLTGKEIDDSMFVPHYPNFDGTITYEDDNKWVCYGVYKQPTKTKLVITEVPIGYTLVKYLSVLNKLKAEGKIKSFVDNCSKGKFNFTITLPRDHKLTTDNKIIAMFKLKRNLNENTTVISPDGKLEVYTSNTTLLKAFCDYRCTLYKARIKKRILDTMEQLEWLKEKHMFIFSIVNEEYLLKNKSTDMMTDELTRLGFKHVDRLLRIRLGSMTSDEIIKLQTEIQEHRTEVDEWKNKDPKTLYEEELLALL